MQPSDIQKLLERYRARRPVLMETHISWLLLIGACAYKIKKPVRFSFLDFSSLDLRRQYCHRELQLNRRLTDGIYLDVIPVMRHNGAYSFANQSGAIVDYAVKMKRMDNARRMDVMLKASEVTALHMHQLADRLAEFHATTARIARSPDIAQMCADFEDLASVGQEIRICFGTQGVDLMHRSFDIAHTFLKYHAQRIGDRIAAGYLVDGHGDLHSGNIFLLDEPVVFDCIEFNDHFRQVDVLDELAFFGLDLELYGRKDLETIFVDRYLSRYPCIESEEDRQLMAYYKLYRANIKTKVQALKARQSVTTSRSKTRYQRVEQYFRLFRKYLLEIDTTGTAR